MRNAIKTSRKNSYQFAKGHKPCVLSCVLRVTNERYILDSVLASIKKKTMELVL